MSVYIADVSSHQSSVDFSAMKQAGVSGCIIRAGYRTYGTGKLTTDSRFSQHTANAQQANMLAGLYWYTTAISNLEAQAEADYFLSLSAPCETRVAWLDLEFAPSQKGRADKLTPAQRTQYALVWLERVRAAGYTVGVYCNLDFWRNSLISTQLSTYPLWLARYSTAKPSTKCDLWQFTSSAQASTYGVSGSALDLSECYNTALLPSSASVASFAMAILQRGDRGQQVAVLQHYLNTYYQASPLTALDTDGIFGQKTSARVKLYQRDNELTVDGIAGSATWSRLLG